MFCRCSFTESELRAIKYQKTIENCYGKPPESWFSAHRGMLSGLQVAISNEEQAREAALTEASRLQGLLEARLETLESGLKDTAVGLKAEISNLEESFSKFCAEEQVGHVTFLLG